MTHSQEARVSSSGDFRLGEESRSSVSALVSRLSSSACIENEKRSDSAKMKDQKLLDPFPWMNGFCNLCQAAVGSRNIRHLENLLNVYLENVTPNVKDCYTKPNRAAKLKKSMNDTLIFFHLFYQEIKETLEHSFYLEKMTALVSMFMDMEIKASLRSKESNKKVASRLTSSLYIFLDNSEDHMLDAILMTKFITKNYREICHPLLWKLLNNIHTYPMHEMLYVRCLLAFKRWKKIVPDAEERKRINKTAMQKLHTPPHLMENIKAMGNVLPRIPKTKKNITLFLMQSNFNLKNACQEFLKSLKKPPKGPFNQVLGVEIDKPLFFGGQSGDSSPRLTEKEDESDSGCSNTLINDIWSSISTSESNAPQAKRLNDLTPEKPSVVDSQELPKKKKKKIGKKKGKKQKVVKCVGNKKKKKSLGSSEKSGKQAKKLNKLKGKKKKKKKVSNSGDQPQVKPKQAASLQAEDKNLTKLVTPLLPNDDSSQVMARSKSPVVEELNQMRVIKAGHLKPDSSLDEESKVAKLQKKPISIQEEKALCKVNEALPQVGAADLHSETIPTLGNKSEKSVDQSPLVEDKKVTNAKKVCQVEESDEAYSNQIPSVVEESSPKKTEPSLPKVDSLQMACAPFETEVSKAKTTQLKSKPDESESKTKAAIIAVENCDQVKVSQPPPPIEEKSQSKSEPPSAQMEDSDLLDIKQAFLQIGDSDHLKLKQAMLKIGEYDEIKVQKVMEQIEASEGRRIRQALYQFAECDEKMREAKIEPQLEIPKTEKCDSPPSAQVQESDLLGSTIEPLVQKVKKEIVTNSIVDASFETESSVASVALSGNVDIGCLPTEKSVDFTKSLALSKEMILSPSEINAKCLQPDESVNTFDNARRDLFSVDSNKDPLSEKALESQVSSTPIILEEGKLSDQKSKTLENATPVSVYAVVEVCDSSLKQEVCDSSETAGNETLDVSKSVQMDSYSDVEIVEELRPQESGKCDVSASEDEIVLSDDGDLLTRQAPLDNIFATGNEDLVIEMFGCSERQYPMSRDVLSGESMEFETDNPPVSDDLEPEPSANLSGYETGMVDNYYSKTIKDDNPTLYDSRSLYRIDEWIQYDRNLKSYELDRPVLPSVWMEEEEDDEITESDLSKSFESTPKRGMGKMSYHDAVMSYSRQRELRASTSGRHNSQGCLMMNSSESGSASTEASPLLTSSASGSSSPRSESAIDPVEGVHETMDTCDNLLKTSELGVSSERVPDVSGMSYYHSNYPKSPDIASCTKDVGYNAQISYTPKIGSHRMDNARVVVEPMEHRLLSQAISDRLTASYSRAETSSKRNISETGSQHPPLKRRKSSKLHPEQSGDSRSSSAKRDTEEAGNYAAQSRATLRGMLSVPMGVELGGNGKSSQYDSTPKVTPTVPPAQYVQGSFVSASQTSNIPTSAYPSISTNIGLGAGSALPPISDLWRCSCAECSVGSVNFGSSTLSKTSYSQIEKAYSQSEKSYDLGDKNFSVSDKNYSESDKNYSESDKNYSVNSKAIGLSEKNYCASDKNSREGDKVFDLTEKIYEANGSSFSTSNKNCNESEKACVETQKAYVVENDESASEKKVSVIDKTYGVDDKSYILDEKSYPYYEKVPGTYETPSEWRSQNEKLLQKIEQSLSTPSYDFNSDSSLPLKKRLKMSKLSYESTADSTIMDPQPKTKLESFPSYPTAPMISIADIDFSNNDFLKKWNSLYLTNKASKSVIVDNRVCNTPANLQSSYLSSQNASHTISNSNYDDTLVKNLQRNLYAHCGQCAEEAVSSVCDSALYGNASNISQIHASNLNVSTCITTSNYSCSSSVANYSVASLSSTASSSSMASCSSSSSLLYGCSSSYNCKASSYSSNPSSSFNSPSVPSTYSSNPSAFKVNSNEYSNQHALSSQCYQIPSGAYYKAQSSSHPLNTKQELYKCDTKSTDVTNVKVNQSGSSKQTQERRKETPDVSYPEKVNPDASERVNNTSHQLDGRHVPPNGRLRQNEVGKHGSQNYVEEEDDDEDEGDEDDDEEDDDDEREAADGDEEEEGDDDEDDDEDVSRKEAPRYTIVQKTVEKGSSSESKKETTRIMPFRIFLNKNKIHKELAKNSCVNCKMVDCKGNCPKPSSGNAGELSFPNSENETNDDSSSDAKCHRRRGRKPKSSKDADESLRKSKRIGSKKCGRGRRGRPPSRGRGVSSCKVSSDKTQRKHGYSGKGRNDPGQQFCPCSNGRLHFDLRCLLEHGQNCCPKKQPTRWKPENAE